MILQGTHFHALEIPAVPIAVARPYGDHSESAGANFYSAQSSVAYKGSNWCSIEGKFNSAGVSYPHHRSRRKRKLPRIVRGDKLGKKLFSVSEGGYTPVHNALY